MAYVRKVRTASGAVAVQVVRKHRGQRTILAHVGSAHTDAQLGILLERARRIAAEDQGVLDIEVAARAQRMDAVADWRRGELMPVGDRILGAPAPPGRTAATHSRLLYDVLAEVYDWLGFEAVGDEVFRDLVIARIVEPTSKADAPRVLADLGAKTLSYRTIQRHLAKIGTGKYRDVIAGRCFTHAADRGGLSLLLYDVTTLYFEAENEDELRKVGFSKERRVDPQIVVGLLVDRTGFPLEVGCFEGNTAETKTLVPVITAFAERHELGEIPMVIAADAGMLSAANLTALDEAGLGFIVGSRSVKAPIDLASHFHWNGDVFTDGQIIDTGPRTTAGMTPAWLAHYWALLRSSRATGRYFCQNVLMARKKTTVYIDEGLLRAAKVIAARTGKHDYEVFEDALRQHLGLAGTLERIWAGITPQDAPDDVEAARIAAEELAAVRAEHSPPRAGRAS